MARNEIEAIRFDDGVLAEVIARHCRNPDAGNIRQVLYLEGYCKDLGAKTLVVESHYVCRHFMDEYAYYYSRNLNLPYRNSVARIHVFSETFVQADLERSLAATLGGHAGGAALQLGSKYLGFISVRPVPEAPIGRTVLQRYRDEVDAERQIGAVAEHHAHLVTLSLSVEGLVFQQQDVAAGACATAALWSAISRVARMEHMRAPTPAEVSLAATGQTTLLSGGPPRPHGTGLTTEQLITATRELGFNDERIRADQKPELFFLWLHTYLLSGVPVVLGLWKPHESDRTGHAVTAAGFQTGARNPKLESIFSPRSSRITKLYVHDDRVGPFARSMPLVSPRLARSGEMPGEEYVLLQIEHEQWLVESAIVPVYPKIRLKVSHLVDLADTTADLVGDVVGATLERDLEVEFQYQRAGTYFEGLSSQAPLAEAATFLRTVALPRWCAIIRWYLADTPLVEFIYDTTDIVRGKRSHVDLLRAIVCVDSAWRDKLRPLATGLGTPFL